MNVLPVIDLLGGMVVRGIAGQRESYRPIQSQISPSAEPRDVARALQARGYDDVYVADLDAIMNQNLSLDSIEQIAEVGLNLWLDAGLRSMDDLHKWPSWLAEQASAIVLGAESILRDQLEALIQCGPQRTVVSLDLMDGKMLGQWHDDSAVAVAALAYKAGCRRFIVLDLASVGTNRGVSTMNLCRSLKTQFPDIELTSGGGVRDADDLASLAACGCEFALVASAIHDGTLA